MANNQPQEGFGDEFFEQILSVQGYNPIGGDHQGSGPGSSHGQSSIFLGLGPGDGQGHGGFRGDMGLGMPLLGLNLDHGTSSSGGVDVGNVDSSCSRINENEMHLTNLFPAFGQLQSHSIRAPPPSIHVHQTYQGQGGSGPAQTVSHPPAMRPRVRARRGQATDPHSIAERTDRAAMLDEIVDYVKFLRLQVKVLSMSRLGGAGAVAQLVADVPPPSFEGEGVEGAQPAWDKWSNDGTEEQVAKLIEQDIGEAMQFLQSKALCIMPISLASTIFRSHPLPPDHPSMVKPESNPPP